MAGALGLILTMIVFGPRRRTLVPNEAVAGIGPVLGSTVTPE